MSHLALWCTENNLLLSINKPKENEKNKSKTLLLINIRLTNLYQYHIDDVMAHPVQKAYKQLFNKIIEDQICIR